MSVSTCEGWEECRCNWIYVCMQLVLAIFLATNAQVQENRLIPPHCKPASLGPKFGSRRAEERVARGSRPGGGREKGERRRRRKEKEKERWREEGIYADREESWRNFRRFQLRIKPGGLPACSARSFCSRRSSYSCKFLLVPLFLCQSFHLLPPCRVGSTLKPFWDSQSVCCADKNFELHYLWGSLLVEDW